jgi:hypothetical protein
VASLPWTNHPNSGVHQSVQLLQEFRPTSKREFEVRLSEDQALFNASERNQAGGQPAAGGTARQEQPEQGGENESPLGGGPDQSERMVGLASQCR